MQREPGAEMKQKETLEDGMKAVLIGALILAVLLLPSAVFLVGIVWSHRPDLSVMDILRGVVTEIRESKTAARECSGGRKDG